MTDAVNVIDFAISMNELFKEHINDKKTILRNQNEIYKMIKSLLESTKIEEYCTLLTSISNTMTSVTITGIDMSPFKNVIIILKGIISHAVQTETSSSIKSTLNSIYANGLFCNDISEQEIDPRVKSLIDNFVKLLQASSIFNI